jgi:hypothetical protein
MHKNPAVDVFLSSSCSSRKITAYLNPVKLYYFFLSVDIYCVVIYSKSAAFKKKENAIFLSAFSPSPRPKEERLRV